jgi:uncharacterized protein YlxP (DUF503 family)
MVIGVLQLELFLGDARSLKDKRRVVASLKDRIGKDPSIGIAEVDRMDSHQIAVLGIVAVSNSGKRAQQVLDRILEQVRHNPRFVLNDHTQEIMTGS